MDTVGILTKIYSYADIAYIGGGFENGIHNILEPATFGVPLIIGPNYQKFQEAIDLVQLKACDVMQNSEELTRHISSLIKNETFRKEKGAIAKNYVKSNTGATELIINYMAGEL